MLTVLFLLLGQFQPSEAKSVTIQEYESRCSDYWLKLAQKEIADAEAKLPSKKVLASLSAGEKRRAKDQKEELEKAKKQLAKTRTVKTIPVYINNMKPGEIGELKVIAQSTTVLPNGRGGASRVGIELREPARLTVSDVINDRMVLMEQDGITLGLIPEKADAHIDGQGFEPTGVYCVVGTFAYKTVGGGSKTVAVVQKWEHSDEWQKLKNEQEAAKKTKTPKE